jgi:hypothetical protein
MGHFRNLAANRREPSSARSTQLLRDHLLAEATSLHGGVAFMDGASRHWTQGELFLWLDDFVVQPGWMRMPRALREPGTYPVELDARVRLAHGFEALTLKARARVGAALSGYLAPVPDERFLHAAIYGGRVRRGLIDGRPAWVPSPRETDFLSDVVLSLFAVDLLQNGDRYRPHMGVCATCSRISFTADGHTVGRRCMRCSGEYGAVKVA